MKQLFQSINEILNKTTRTKKWLTALMVLVVFVTTYILILPAFTLTQEKAEQQGGIDIPAMEMAAEEAADEEAGSVDSENEAKTAVKTVDKAKSENKAEATNDSAAEAAAQADPLTFEGEGFTVAVDDPKSVLPEDTEVVAAELLEKPEEGTKEEIKDAEETYKKYYELAQKAVKEEDGADDTRSISFVKFYDISLQSAGEVVQPDKPVNVTISYDKDQQKDLKVDEKKNVKIIHFAEDQETGEITAEILKKDTVDVSLEKKKMAETTFEAESFSVYGVVYTVDFSYEVDGKNYEYSIKGGEGIGLSELLPTLGVIKDDKDTDVNEVKEFIGQIENVKFSDENLVSVSKADSDTTIGGIKDALGLECDYSAELSDEQKEEINSKAVEAGDWALISLKAFDTEETLTITMKNGEAFTVKVADEQKIDTNDNIDITGESTYIICTYSDGRYHVLKTDGTVDNRFTNTDQFDALGNDYRWTINYVFTEKHRESTHEFKYYFIRPANDKTKTIALNDVNEDLVQSGTNNIAIEAKGDDDGGFTFRGYNISEDSHVMLEFRDGQFKAVYEADPDTAPVRIFLYEQEVLPRFNFTVQTADPEIGKVSGRDVNNQAQNNVNSFNTITTETSSNNDKTNQYQITANPVPHQNNELQSWQPGYGQNKWTFDYWDIDGAKLDPTVYGEALNPGALPVTANGSILTAHFKQNPSYVVPDSEKDGTNINKQELENWLNALKGADNPLDASATDKTAEVYDYENRIYRVDLTTKPSLSTFEGIIDMGFILDVSASMKFPSRLKEISGMESVDLRYINNGYGYWSNGRYLWNYSGITFDTGTHYYFISDPKGTSTVFELYWNSNRNRWYFRDASTDDTNKFYEVTADNLRYYSKAGNDSTTDNNYHYQLYLDDDGGKQRRDYLLSSLNGTLGELQTILDTLSLAADLNENPEVNVAWNTFCNYLPNGTGEHQYDFIPASNGITLTFDDGTFAGGTSTDIALLDAAGKRRGDVSADNDVHSKSSSVYKTWKRTTADYDDSDNTDKRFYTYADSSKGFQWDSGATKYAVLITDGAPQRSGESIDSRYIVDAANQLKDGGNVKLITIGLSMENVTNGKILLYDIADTDAEGHKMFYSAKSGDELQYALYDILKRIIKDATVQGDVTDTINEAFYPVDKATGKALDNNDKISLDGNLITGTPDGPYGTIIKEGNATTGYTYRVKWENQDFPLDGWHGSVYVKAYEDLLGGNAVRTNEGMAVIEAKSYKVDPDEEPIVFKDESSVPEAERKLKTKKIEKESPRVNVNELTFPNTDSEWTVYLGTEVDPKDELKRLFENAIAEEVVNDGKDTDQDKFHIPDMIDYTDENSHHYPLAENDITDSREGTGTAANFKLKDLIYELIQDCIANGDTSRNDWSSFISGNDIDWEHLISVLQSGSLVIPYDKYGLNDLPHKVRNTYGTEGTHYDNSTVTISLTSDVVSGEDDLDPSPHDTKVVGAQVEKYTLTVLYSPDYDVLPRGQGGKSIEDFHVGEYGTMYQGHAAGTETSTNTHIINVIVKGLHITKTDLNDEILTGAKFSLYRTAREGETPVDPTPEGLEGNYVKVADFDTSGDGTSLQEKIDSLGDGEKYYLVETQTPAGYNTMTPAEVSLTITDKYTTLPDGTEASSKPANEPYNWTQSATLTLTGANIKRVDENGSEYSASASDDTDPAIYYYKIANNPGVVLPHTGGIGTTIFYVLGSLLVIGSTVVLISRRRIRK